MTTDPHPSDPTVPADPVALVPAPPDTVPLRNPADAWALVITTVRLGRPWSTRPTDLMAGVWLPAQPSADLHQGDVAVRLHPPANHDPAKADVEVLIATAYGWHSVQTLPAMSAHWPHYRAATIMAWMRALADEAERAIGQRLFTSSVGMPPYPDGLDQLIDAGLIAPGEEVVWNGHTATVGHGGALLHGTDSAPLFPTAVSALATRLATPTTVNGWYLWRCARDDRPLADLRAELADAPRSTQR